MEPLQDHEIDSDEEMEGNWIDMERIQFALEAEQMFQNDNNLDNALDETSTWKFQFWCSICLYGTLDF